jgi:hypothetical protein
MSPSRSRPFLGLLSPSGDVQCLPQPPSLVGLLDPALSHGPSYGGWLHTWGLICSVLGTLGPGTRMRCAEGCIHISMDICIGWLQPALNPPRGVAHERPIERGCSRPLSISYTLLLYALTQKVTRPCEKKKKKLPGYQALSSSPLPVYDGPGRVLRCSRMLRSLFH